MSDLFGKPTTSKEYQRAAIWLAGRLERNERALLFPAPRVKALLAAPKEKTRVERIALDLAKVKSASPVLVSCPNGQSFHYGKACLRELAGGAK